VLDGSAPQADGKEPLPQVERRLVVRVENVRVFTHAPHTHQEAGGERGAGAAV
jgi:hypothetical protein